MPNVIAARPVATGYLGDIPPELRAIAAEAFALLGIVDRILSEIR